jgi:hypothetical protein
MEIRFNVIGPERKKLANAVGCYLGQPVVYKRTPTFAFTVGGLTIDKAGVLIGDVTPGLLEALVGGGFENYEYGGEAGEESHAALECVETAQSSEEENSKPEETLEDGEGQPANHSESDTDPVSEQDPGELNDEVEVDTLGKPEQDESGEPISVTQVTEYAGPPEASEPSPQPEDAPPAAPETTTLTIEMPLGGFTEQAFVNLEKMVASKASLIMKATGAAALTIERADTTLRFPWFSLDQGEPEAANAYAQFVGKLGEAAKKQKRVTAKEKPVENERFAFRVFLVRLGMVGGEYKTARRLLLKNLSGNSAFKNGAPPKPNTTEE